MQTTKGVNDHLLHRLRELLWEREVRNRLETELTRLGRYIVVLARDLMDGQLSMRAMSLVYTTLLSLVPLLALGFSVLKALGVHDMLRPTLLKFLEPLGPQAETLTQNIIGFVENIKVGVLGSLGVALLFYAAVSMIQKVESSFNYIWHIERARSVLQRMGEYLYVLMIGPMAVFLALGITATVLNSAVVSRLTTIEPFGTTIFILTKLIPYALIVGVFTFLYSFIPNTRVRVHAALAGGLLAGVAWQSASLLFASFVVSATNYNAIYSGFAILIFLLIWLYVGWLILLTGCQLSFYVQHPEHLTPTRTAPYLSGRMAEELGLAVIALVGQRFLAGKPGLTEEDISKALNATPQHVDRVVEVLLHHGMLIEAGTDRTQLLPGRDFGSYTLAELWQLVRRGFDRTGKLKTRDELTRSVLNLLDGAETSFAEKHGGMTVRDWLLQNVPRA